MALLTGKIVLLFQVHLSIISLVTMIIIFNVTNVRNGNKEPSQTTFRMTALLILMLLSTLHCTGENQHMHLKIGKQTSILSMILLSIRHSSYGGDNSCFGHQRPGNYRNQHILFRPLITALNLFAIKI